MDTLYEIGDAILLEFHAERNGTRLLPIGALVSIYNSLGEIVRNDTAEITPEETVRYYVDPSLTKTVGDYIARFNLQFPSGMPKVHAVRFVVVPRVMPEETKGMEVDRLCLDSSDQDIDYAVAYTIRGLRRYWRMEIEEAAEKAYITAQKRIGKRIPK